MFGILPLGFAKDPRLDLGASFKKDIVCDAGKRLGLRQLSGRIVDDNGNIDIAEWRGVASCTAAE